MAPPKIHEVHTRTATVKFEDHELLRLLAREAGEISGMKNAFISTRGNRAEPKEGQPVAEVRWLEVTEGSPAYKVGLAVEVKITETLVDQDISPYDMRD